MKVCTKCKIEKPKTEFSKAANKKSGLRSNCKGCCSEYSAANREKQAAYHAAYRKENKARLAAQGASYYYANLERISAHRAGYRSANRDKIAARIAEYVKANPDKVAANDRNRRARKRNAEGKHTATDVRAIFEKQQGLCTNCQTKLFKSGKQKYHVDHIMPLALGGSNWPANLQCLCPTCNLSKGAKHPDDWAKQQGRLL